MPDILNVDTEPTKPAQTPAPPTEPSGWMSADGEIRDSAPENIRTLMEKKKWTNINQIVDGYGELEKFKGAGEHLVIPEAEDVEGWDKIRTQLGWVGSADKYEFTYDGDVSIGDELIGQFKEYANQRRWSQKEFEETVRFQLDAVAAQTEAYNVQTREREQENILAMKNKWGEANYDSTFRGIEATAQKLGVLEFFRKLNIDKEPEIVNMLITINSSDAEDTITPSTPPAATKTPLEELSEIKTSKAFLEKFNPEHKACMARFMELNMIVANAGQGSAPRA